MSSGPGSDPHLLALLRAIRLRQSAPDAAAAGEADAAAALSEISPPAPQSAEPAPAPPEAPAPVPPAVTSFLRPATSTGGATRAGNVAGIGRTTPSGEPAPRPAGDEQPAAPPSTRTGPGSELLWRGDQGAALGRSGLGPGARRPGAADRAGASAAYGVPVNRVNPITGINPGGPVTPAPAVPGVPPARPIGAPGTEFPSVSPAEYAAHFARNTTRRHLPSDGMDPGDTLALRDTQRLLSTSLTFAGGIDEVAERLWRALLQAQPDLLTALPGTADSQRRQLARAITWLVHRLDDPPAVVAGAGQLGAVLAECGVQWSQLHLVGAALAEAMRAGMVPGVWRQDFDQAWRWTWQHVYEWIVHGGTLIAYQPTIWETEVISHQRRRPDLAVVRLRPFLPMPYRPGQYARVEVADVPGIWRPYSLAGAPQVDDVIELHVRAKTETGVSGTLVHHTRTGDRIRIGRAEGDMGLPEEPGRGVLMIAGDTGVAPMKAMLAQLAALGDTRPAVLFWGVRNLGELYDIDELTALARQAPRATVVPVVAEGDPGPYPSGLVTDAVAAYGEWSRHEVYLAGPPLMLAATGVALRQLGVDPARIHHDAPE
ncbi:flavohemoprotein [Actinoplanes oblitus]|uniref:Flavohemoprotein n=1 Tax=Actinoplanes oblitus TaxID=3040509 RepID=A0ABY8WR74_9ACTN|nr:flavohemoprotein [Actinoplanes oblitus]WIM98295.1 flavohemoprotein [Actinoplanes oblitus]